MKYDDTNKGTLFKNDKRTTDKHPDYTGKINVGGTEFRLAAWIRVGKNGSKFMSLAVSESQEQGATTRASAPVDMSDEIPF